MPLSETDRRLIKDLLSRSDGAWETFIDRYAGLVIQVIRHTSHAQSFKLSPDDEDDLCADVFAGLIDRRMAALRSFRGRSSLATWLTVVVRRIVLRKLKQKRYAEALGHVAMHSKALEQATDDQVTAIEDRDEVTTLMSRLPVQSRKALGLFYLDGLSYREIARRLGISSNAVGPLLSRIRCNMGVRRPQ
jgi:RNA polymerase sigma-70 factor (ECF subfamily)